MAYVFTLGENSAIVIDNNCSESEVWMLHYMM